MNEHEVTPAWRHGAVAVAAVALAAVSGRFATAEAVSGWYVGLTKPWFTPPSAVFAPVWLLLYAGMALALFRILRLPAKHPGRPRAIVLFMGQLVLNAGWSWAFFGLKNPTTGLIVILPLLGLVLLTMRVFWPLDRIAALIFAPYALWVAFAALLNLAIWRMN